MTGAVLLALLPIVILTALGLASRRRGFLAEGFRPQAERLGYFVLLPSLLFHSLATARIEAVPVGALALTLILSTLAVAALVLALRPCLKLDGPAFTSVFQGGVRFDNYVGVTLAAGLSGPPGCSGHWASRWRPSPTPRSSPPSTSSACWTSPGTARHWVGPVLAASATKSIAMPAATILVALGLGLHGSALTTAPLFQVLPTASSAYILARQLGGDAPPMAGITAAQTVLALVAMPLVLIALAPRVPI